MLRSIAFVALACVAFSETRSIAQQPIPVDPLNENAALSYWQAFALLPKLEDEMRQVLGPAVIGDTPIDNQMRELVKSSETALRYLHRGNRIDACAWGVAHESGPYAYLPHLSKARDLARVALLRARMRVEDGQVDGAIDDIVAAVQLGRNAGQDGVIVLINILVGYAIETEAIETIADSLHALDQPQRDRLKSRLDEIKPKLDMRAALVGEKDVFLGWLIREIEKPDSKDSIFELASGDIEEATKSRIEAAPQPQLVQWARDLGAFYDAGFEVMQLPPEEAMAKTDEIVKRLDDEENGNPLGRLFLPAFGAARNADAAFDTRSTMLNAAFALFSGGKGALKDPKYRDPFGDGSFELKEVDGGVELVSDFARGGSPVALTIAGWSGSAE